MTATDALLLCGPTGAGKTRHVLGEYVAHADRHGDDAVALLLPTGRAVARAGEAIVRARAGAGLLDPRLFTFPALADALLVANHTPVQPLSALGRRLLLGEVLRRLSGEGGLSYLAEVHQLRGFLGAVGQVIDELKRAAIEPASFLELARRRLPDHPANEDLGAIYAAYQELLTSRSLYDEAGAFWEARDLLRAGKCRPLDSVSLLLVDGFSEFTPTQLEVLDLLCRQIPQTIITLCLEPVSADGPDIVSERETLFAVTRRTRDQLRARLPAIREEWLPAPAPHHCLAAVKTRLFGTVAAAPASEASALGLTDDRSVRLLGAPGVRTEVREVARRIKGLILGGVSPREIAVVLRSPAIYELSVREVFAEYGIPLELPRGEALVRCPAVRAVLDVLDVAAGDYQRDDVTKLANSNYVDLTGLLADTCGLTPDALEAMALRARIIGGKGCWVERLHLLARRLERELEQAEGQAIEDEDEPPARGPDVVRQELGWVQACQLAFERLVALVEPIAQAPDLTAAVAALGEAIAALGLVPAASRPDVGVGMAARDLAALALLLDGLQELARAEAELGVATRLAPGEFAGHVRELCATLRLPGVRPTGAAVVVLDVFEARQLRVAHVFLPGLSEGVFPPARRQDPFYHDEDRRRLNAGGIVLEERLPRQAEESFLFYQALAATEECVWLSYPVSDAEGKPMLRSHYVDEVSGLFAAPLPEEVVRLSAVIRPLAQACCPRELAEAALRRVWHEPGADGASHAAGVCALHEQHPRLLERIAHAAGVEDERDSARPPGRYDGALAAPAIHARLRADFGIEHRFSASQLSVYGQCPFRFWLERVLRLAGLDAPSEEVTPLELGALAHRALEAFFAPRAHSAGAAAPLTPDEVESERRRMTDIVAATFRRREGLAGHRKLWQLTAAELRDDLLALVEFEAADKHGNRLVWVTEHAYGLEQPFVLGAGDEAVRLEGRIDRVDVLRGTDPPQFVLLDYKLGNGKSIRRVLEGTDFQLPLYCMAAERELFAGRGATCAWWAYYRVRRPVQWKNYARPTGDLDIATLVARATATILEYAAQIRSGQFPVIPRECTEGCDFATICRTSRHRMERKLGAAATPAHNESRRETDDLTR